MAATGVADRLLRRSPAQWAFQARRRHRLAVVTFHAVPDAARFERQVDVLASTGTFIALDDLLAAMEQGEPLPARAILVTFDDGDRTLYETAAPVLVARRIPAAAFVLSGVIGTDEPLWWTEVEQLFDRGGQAAAIDGAGGGDPAVALLKQIPDGQRLAAIDALRATARSPADRQLQLSAPELVELAAAGIAIGSHSATHPILTQCDAATVEREVSGSLDALTAMLGHPPAAFVYPNGDHDASVRDAVAAAGYRVAFTFDHRLSRVPPPDALAVSRLRVSAAASDERIRTILSGLHPALHHARGRP